MSEVFVSESSLDLHWEVIIHSQECEGILIVVEFVSPVEADVTPHKGSKLAHIPTTCFCKIRVPDGEGK